MRRILLEQGTGKEIAVVTAATASKGEIVDKLSTSFDNSVSFDFPFFSLLHRMVGCLGQLDEFLEAYKM